MDRTGLEFILSLVSLQNKNSSHCHLDIIHGSGASPLRLPVHLRPSIYDATGTVNGYGRRNRISGCRSAQGPEWPGQAAVVRWKRCRVPRLSIQLQNIHEHHFCFTHADGQMRSRAESDLPGSSESSGRSTLAVLRADVKCIGLDNIQNRQYALMQKIKMPAKPWCDHTERFESGLRSWELDVGEWERASGTALADAVKYTVMMNVAPIFLRNSLQLGAYANSTALRAAKLRWCYSSRNFGANPTASSGNGTTADDDRVQ